VQPDNFAPAIAERLSRQPRRCGRPVARVTKGFKRAVERSGIASCTIHDLRRTCASWLLQEGASFAQVAAYLGDTEDMIRRH